jgi:transcriptional regulator with XRE-family HTH domain
MTSTTRASAAAKSTHRDWTIEELRLAARLTFNPDGRDDLNVAALAEAVGVSDRQVRRWLSGQARPTRETAQRLRAALLPPADVLQRQDDDARNARAALLELAGHDDIDSDGSAGAGFNARTAMWAERGWLDQHLLLVVANPDLGYTRAGAVFAAPTRVRALLETQPRPASLPQRQWQVLDAYATPTRFDAVLLRHAVLERMGPWRVSVNPSRMPKGHSDGWLFSAPLPALPDLARRVGARGRAARRQWVTTAGGIA